MLDGQSLMGWFATVSSKAMVRPMLGRGSVYMWTSFKGWFTIFRLYGSIESYMDGSWKPGEIESI